MDRVRASLDTSVDGTDARNAKNQIAVGVSERRAQSLEDCRNSDKRCLWVDVLFVLRRIRMIAPRSQRPKGLGAEC